MKGCICISQLRISMWCVQALRRASSQIARKSVLFSLFWCRCPLSFTQHQHFLQTPERAWEVANCVLWSSNAIICNINGFPRCNGEGWELSALADILRDSNLGWPTVYVKLGFCVTDCIVLWWWWRFFRQWKHGLLPALKTMTIFFLSLWSNVNNEESSMNEIKSCRKLNMTTLASLILNFAQSLLITLITHFYASIQWWIFHRCWDSILMEVGFYM